ncbi:MAG: 16S rRNA (cytidine(1402)-2'-O)-methyltransferase [Gammaproteobacteria bacterium]
MAQANPGVLYVVATPIGNLEDFAPRAQRILSEVALIAAEDTRRSGKLLMHFGIHTPLVSLHDHNEAERTPSLIAKLQAGESLALISDAGTPLISDPGFDLVRAARAAGLRVVSVPGPSALIAALSVSGLPTDRFVFEGFLPARRAARRARIAELIRERRTLIFYESPQRLAEVLEDMSLAFGAGRRAVVARELTKVYESVHVATLAELAAWARADDNARLGEAVVLVAGAVEAAAESLVLEPERLLRELLEALPLKQAVALAARLSGGKKNELYKLALEIHKRE